MIKHFITQYIAPKQFCFGALFLILCGSSTAQDSVFDELSLNGLSTYVQLRNEYYVGALYLENLNSDAPAILSSSGAKRMELRVIIDKWSSRRFAQQWNQLLLINNDSETVNDLSDQILSFLDMPKGNLVADDKITIDLDPDNGTTVYLNGIKAFEVADNDFFNILLNTWIGPRPPSSGFKQDILTLSTDSTTTDLLTRYENTKPSQKRINQVAAWFTKKEKQAKPASEESEDNISQEVIASGPPSTDTTVAKRIDTTAIAIEKPKIESPIKSNSNVPKPVVQLDAPAFTTSPVSIAQGVDTPTTDAASSQPTPTKAAESSVAAKDAETSDTVDEKQEQIFSDYQSQIVKLTFSNTVYPDRAYKFKHQGKVILKVVIDREGKVIDIIEDKLSKFSTLNKAAIKAVKRTAPYPEPPTEIVANEVTITLPFTFRI